MSPDIFDFEVGLKVSAQIKPAGRVKPGELPAAEVACTTYTGPHEGLPAAWGGLTEWIEALGHKPAGDLWEIHSAGPQSMPDSADWRTELYRPFKD